MAKNRIVPTLVLVVLAASLPADPALADRQNLTLAEASTPDAVRASDFLNTALHGGGQELVVVVPIRRGASRIRCSCQSLRQGTAVGRVKVAFDVRQLVGDRERKLVRAKGRTSRANGWLAKTIELDDPRPEGVVALARVTFAGRALMDAARCQCTVGEPLLPCVEGPTQACLQGNRFKVETFLLDLARDTALRLAIDRSDEESVVFDDPALGDVLLLVLLRNNCASSWAAHEVYADSQTSAPYLLRITDTLSGVRKEYRNRTDVFYHHIGDTRALSTCP